MTKRQWMEEAERYQQLMDASDDETTRAHYEAKRNACYSAADYAPESE